jgi:hypothetical protein
LHMLAESPSSSASFSTSTSSAKTTAVPSESAFSSASFSTSTSPAVPEYAPNKKEEKVLTYQERTEAGLCGSCGRKPGMLPCYPAITWVHRKQKKARGAFPVMPSPRRAGIGPRPRKRTRR